MTKKPVVVSCGPGGISAFQHARNVKLRDILTRRGFQFYVTVAGYSVTETVNGRRVEKGRAASSVDEQADDVLKRRAYQDNLALALSAAYSWRSQENSRKSA